MFVLCEANVNSENGIIMKKKTPIKVIKREERNRQQAASESAAPERKTAQETAREMVATVTGWVAEFQQQRRAETRQALKTLFRDNAPQPGEA